MRPTSRQFKLSWQEQLGLASVADSDGQMTMKELVDIYEKRSLRARFRSRIYASIAVKRTQMLPIAQYDQFLARGDAILRLRPVTRTKRSSM